MANTEQSASISKADIQVRQVFNGRQYLKGIAKAGADVIQPGVQNRAVIDLGQQVG